MENVNGFILLHAIYYFFSVYVTTLSCIYSAFYSKYKLETDFFPRFDFLFSKQG